MFVKFAVTPRTIALRKAIAIFDEALIALEEEWGPWCKYYMTEDRAANPAGCVMRARRHLMSQLLVAELPVWISESKEESAA